MDFIELSIEEVDRLSRDLASRVLELNYKPDLVVYLARGGWLMGRAVADELSCPMLELSTHRSGDAIKTKGSRMLQSLPRFVRKMLRTIEIKKRLKEPNAAHGKQLRVTDRYETPRFSDSILLVDDSADTGVSLRAAVDLLSGLYPKSDIKVAVFNAFTESRNIVDIEVALFENTLLCLPSSKDSKDYKRFLSSYSCGE